MSCSAIDTPKKYLADQHSLAKIETTLGHDRDFVHFFTTQRAELESKFPLLVKAIKPGGMIWISWPKKSSGEATDLDENHVRTIGLAAGVVDVKVAAIDDVWSGLKFVYRLKDR